MRAKTFSYTPVTTSAAGLANDVTLATSATLAATAATDGLAHLITVLGNAATNHSAKTITITGTDADGNTLSEGIAGPNGVATVTTTKYFRTVTSVVASATCGADTFDIGWNVVGFSPTIPLDTKQNPFSVGLMTDIAGTINYTVQYTLQDVLNWRAREADAPQQGGATFVDNASPMAAATADQTSNYTFPATAMRLKINTVTNGATIKLSVIQGSNG